MSKLLPDHEDTMFISPPFDPAPTGLMPITILSVALSLLVLALRLYRLERKLQQARGASGTRYRTARPSFAARSRVGKANSITEPFGGIVESAKHCGGKSIQEDACAHLMLPGCNVVAVADGVSGTANAGMAARIAIGACVESMSRSMLRGGAAGPAAIREAFRRAQEAISLESRLNGWEQNPPATTLILALEIRDRFLLGYAGDGAAVLLRGNLQWMTNLLHPYTGRAGAITRFLSADSDAWEPAILELPKGWPDGGMLLIGTDGSLVQGKVLETAQKIMAEIKETANESRFNQARAFHAVLDEWVSRRLDTDDNRSLGLLVSAEALSFWKAQK